MNVTISPANLGALTPETQALSRSDAQARDPAEFRQAAARQSAPLTREAAPQAEQKGGSPASPDDRQARFRDAGTLPNPNAPRGSLVDFRI